MLVRIKIFFLKLYFRNQRQRDVRIVTFLSDELFVKNNVKISDLFYKTMDDYIKSKSDLDIKELIDIMKSKMAESEEIIKIKTISINNKISENIDYIADHVSLPNEINDILKASK